MAENPAKPQTGRNSANLIARNKDSPFQILDVRSLTSTIDDEGDEHNIEDAKIPDEDEDICELSESAVKEEDAAEEDTAAEKDESEQQNTEQNAATIDQDPQEEATAIENETADVEDDSRPLNVANDEAAIEKDAVDTEAKTPEKPKGQHHHRSPRRSENAYSTDEEPELVIDMSFEEEESPKKGERTTANKDAAESEAEQARNKPVEPSDRTSNGSAEPITLSNESDDELEEDTRKEAKAKEMKLKADHFSEVDAGVDGNDEEGRDDDDEGRDDNDGEGRYEDDDDDVEFVEEMDEVVDLDSISIKEEEEDEMDEEEIAAEINTLVNLISGLRVASNELLQKHHTVQINFANAAEDTKNYDDCLKWTQAYLRGSG